MSERIRDKEIRKSEIRNQKSEVPNSEPPNPKQALYASTVHRCHDRTPLPAEFLEGVRSVGAVKWC